MEPGLAQELAVLLRERGLTIAVAESATGGLVSDLITNVPGSSDYFKGSVVAYDNEIKVGVLGVSGETLERHGAVSYQTADEMADGVRKLMNASIGLSTTGIAGPAGATAEKPVGLFYIGISSALGTRAAEHVFSGDRLQNKKSAAEAALILLKEHLASERG
ncbi:Nicotinamide-nucleotide amidohydrolase PncC [subsurface metagenome]